MHLVNKTQGTILAGRVEVCDTPWTRSRGLMFRRALGEDEALWFQLDRPGRLTAAIHMFFVFFPISVLWLDREGRVVDMALARPFRPWYAPARAAATFVEGHPALLKRCQVGDLLALEP